MSKVYIEKENRDHEVLNNDTGAALEQYDFTVIGGLSCIADADIPDGEYGSFHTEEALEVQADSFVATEDTFATPNADVFWDPTSGNFSDTSTIGYYKVGIVTQVKNSNGVVWFSKNRVAVEVTA